MCQALSHSSITHTHNFGVRVLKAAALRYMSSFIQPHITTVFIDGHHSLQMYNYSGTYSII